MILVLFKDNGLKKKEILMMWVLVKHFVTVNVEQAL